MDVSGEQDEERVREAFRGPRRLIGSGGRAFRNEADDLVVQPGDEGRDYEPEDANRKTRRGDFRGRCRTGAWCEQTLCRELLNR